MSATSNFVCKTFHEFDASNKQIIVFVKFADADDVCVALHLSNTIFIDRAIVVSAVLDGKIPDLEFKNTYIYP